MARGDTFKWTPDRLIKLQELVSDSQDRNLIAEYFSISLNMVYNAIKRYKVVADKKINL
jgi:hypothetical protein